MSGKTERQLARGLSRVDLLEALDLIAAAVEAQTLEQLQRLMVRAMTLIPADRCHASLVDLDDHGIVVRMRHVICLGFPRLWLEAYRHHGYIHCDPLARHLLAARGLLNWSQVRRLCRGPAEQRFCVQAAEFGLRDGVSFGRRFARSSSASFFSFAGLGVSGRRRHLVISRHLLPHLHGALARIRRGELRPRTLLTVRETEVLKWARFGKTNGDIGVQLGISERAAKFHIGNAMQKLYARNRLHAVTQAVSQGLIDWE